MASAPDDDGAAPAEALHADGAEDDGGAAQAEDEDGAARAEDGAAPATAGGEDEDGAARPDANAANPAGDGPTLFSHVNGELPTTSGALDQRREQSGILRRLLEFVERVILRLFRI